MLKSVANRQQKRPLEKVYNGVVTDEDANARAATQQLHALAKSTHQ